LSTSNRGDGRRPVVALVTCDDIPELESDAPLLLEALDRKGLVPRIVSWTDQSVDWDSFALNVVRGTWDYVFRRDEYVSWTRSTPRLFNPADVLEWNTDKRYIADLDDSGVAVVPTRFVAPGEDFELPAGEIVLKPTVGAGGIEAGLFGSDETDEAATHVRALHAAGRAVMVQPYRAQVDRAEETGLIYIGDSFSHAISKGPQLRLEPRVAPDHIRDQVIASRSPTDAERAVAERALDAVPGGRERLLYARVDVVPGPDGPEVLELEVTEPSLFLDHCEGSADRLAAAIVSLIER
jgi:glutathione synthase/RimK-type ligase-like ATP-grasp enzyme